MIQKWCIKSRYLTESHHVTCHPEELHQAYFNCTLNWSESMLWNVNSTDEPFLYDFST